MEKVMAMNGFEELKENELMGIEGGIPIIPLLIAAGLALTLTGCGPESTPEERGIINVHRNMGCESNDTCVSENEAAECPFH